MNKLSRYKKENMDNLVLISRGVLAEDRFNSVAPVAYVKYQTLLRWNWLLVSAAVCPFQNDVYHAHLLLMRKQSNQTQRVVCRKTHGQMTWNVLNINTNVPARLEREGEIILLLQQNAQRILCTQNKTYLGPNSLFLQYSFFGSLEIFKLKSTRIVQRQVFFRIPWRSSKRMKPTILLKAHLCKHFTRCVYFIRKKFIFTSICILITIIIELKEISIQSMPR